MKSFLLSSEPLGDRGDVVREALAHRAQHHAISATSSCYEWLIAGEDDGERAFTTRPGCHWRAHVFSQRPLRETRLFAHEIETKLGEASPGQAMQRLTELLRPHEEESAWVIVNALEGAVIVSRDPLGLCPIYLWEHAGSLVITNTYLALAPWLKQATSDPVSLAEMAVSSFPADRTRTAWNELRRLEPGGIFLWQAGNSRGQRWWNYETPELQALDWPEAIAEYRARMSRAVEARLGALPTILELSGGVDSSGIAAVATLSQRGRPHYAATWYDGAPEHDLELPLAEETTRRLRLEHWALDLNRADTHLPPAPWGAFVSRGIAERAPSGVHVVLSGHGGDPLSRVTRGDIDRVFRELGLRDLKQAHRMQRLLHGHGPPLFLRHRILGNRMERTSADRRLPWIVPELHDALRARKHAETMEHRAWSGRRAMTELPMWSTVFEISDPGFTGETLRWRFPYFDLELIRFMDSLPAFPFLLNKKLAREAWRERLPERVVDRPKTLAADQSARLPSAEEVERWMASSTARALDGTVLAFPALRRLAKSPADFPRWSQISARNAFQLLRWFSDSERAPFAGSP